MTDWKLRAERAEAVIRNLLGNPHLNLGDLVYTVRDNELMGWDGPSVTHWSDAVKAAEEIVRETT